ncbi:hypothetical protein HPB47_000047, partial [Ixodes persulcatus]
RKLTEALLEIMSDPKNTKKTGKTLSAIEKMTNLTIKLMKDNAFNRGRIEGLKETVSRLTSENTSLREELEKKEKRLKKPSYAAILRTMTKRNQPKQSHLASQMEQSKTSENQPKDGLLIYSTESSDTQPFFTVKTMLRKFTPHELGLSNPEVKPIRGGAIVLDSKIEDLLTLQSKIERDPETKAKFEAKISVKKKKNPQISILGVDREITNEELKSEIITQNHLEGEPEDIRVVISFDKQETKTHIMELQGNRSTAWSLREQKCCTRVCHRRRCSGLQGMCRTADVGAGRRFLQETERQQQLEGANLLLEKECTERVKQAATATIAAETAAEEFYHQSKNY